MVHETRTRPTKHKAKSSRKVFKELKEGLSFGLLTRLKEDKTMISVSLSLQPRAAAAVLTPGVECVALKELRALRARILPSNRLLDALDLSRIIRRTKAESSDPYCNFNKAKERGGRRRGGTFKKKLTKPRRSQSYQSHPHGNTLNDINSSLRVLLSKLPATCLYFGGRH
jgi:hypothetical protein